MYNKWEKPLPNGWALTKMVAYTDAPDVLANIVAKKGGGIMPLVEMKRLQEATRDDMVCCVNCSVPFFPWVLLRSLLHIFG